METQKYKFKHLLIFCFFITTGGAVNPSNVSAEEISYSCKYFIDAVWGEGTGNVNFTFNTSKNEVQMDDFIDNYGPIKGKITSVNNSEYKWTDGETEFTFDREKNKGEYDSDLFGGYFYSCTETSKD